MQTNKVKDIIAFISLIHSVDSFKLAEEIDNNAKKIRRTIDILVQVNTSEEPQKYGVHISEAASLANKHLIARECKSKRSDDNG
ncbi:MAG: hypothetical protein R3A12_07230 [Ignavibacteria bacterium]